MSLARLKRYMTAPRGSALQIFRTFRTGILFLIPCSGQISNRSDFNYNKRMGVTMTILS